MTKTISSFYKHSNLKNNMNTMLVNNNAALTVRSFFALLLMVGMVNVANATTYYTATTGSATLTGNTTTSSGWSISSSGPFTSTPTIIAADVLVIQGTCSVAYSAAANTTIGGLIISGGTITSSSNKTLTINGVFAGNISGTALGSGTLGGGTAFTIALNGGSATSASSITGFNTTGATITYSTFWASLTYTGLNTTWPTFQLYGYYQIGGASIIPGKLKIGNSTTPAVLNLKGNSLSVDGLYMNSTSNTNQFITSSTSGSTLKLINNGTATGCSFGFDQTSTGSTNLVNLQVTAAASVTLYSSICLDASSSLTSGKIYMNGQNVKAATFPTGSSTSYLAEGTSASSTTGGTVTITSPASGSTPTTVPIGTYNTYLPISFANTTLTPSYTIGVAALTSAYVLTSASCVPFQWSILSSVASSQSDITFYSTSSTGLTSSPKLGVLLTGITAYSNMTTNLASAFASSSAGSFYATYTSYTLPANITANTFVIGNSGSVFPLPTITSATSGSASAGQPYSYTITGANAGTFNATNLPAGLSFSSPNIAGSPSGSGLTNISLTNTNIAGTATSTLALTVTSAPIISSATIGVAQAGALFSYSITANNSPTSFAANLISNGVGSALSGSSTPFSISGATISGTPSSFGIDSIQLVASNIGGDCPTTYLVLNVLDVPTVTSISPSTSKVDTITTGVDSITINGTNFANGYSTVTWAGNAVPTTYYSSTQLRAAVPYNYLSHSVSTNTATVGVTSAGINAAATPSTVSLASTANQTFTLTVSTPTISAIYPSSNIAGAGSFIITVYGTNFVNGVSTVTWNGTPLVTTYLNVDSIRATVPAGNITSAGTANIGVSNIGAGITNASGTTKIFTTYAQGVTWSFATDGAAFTTSGVNLSATTLVGAPTNTKIVGYNYDSINNSRNPSALAICPSASSTSITWNADGGPSAAPVTPTINSTFSGVMINNVNTSRYVQFDVAPQTGYNFSISNIAIPITNNTNTGTMYYAVAYSLDGFSSFNYLTSGTTAGVQINSRTNYIFSNSSSIIIPDGTTLSIRIIVFDNKNSSSSVTGTINLNNVIIVGTTSTAYASPTLTSAATDVTASQNAVFDGSYTYAATQVIGHPNVYSATGLPAGLSIDATSGAVTGTPTVQGTFSVVFKADNSNLFPLFTTINFIIDGQTADPTTTSISPTTKAVDAAQFTLAIKGTNFVSGKSTAKWIASTGDTTSLATTFLTDSTLSAIIPANLVAATVASATPKVVVYNTGAINPTSNTRTFTITNITPVINAISPAASTTSASQFTLTVYGSNFTTNSKVTWGGSVRTTTFVSSTQLTAIVNTNATDLASTGNTAVGVSNTLVAANAVTVTTQTYVVGNASATWVSGANNTPTIVGNLNSSITTTPTLNGVLVSYNSGQVRCGTSSGATTYPADGLTSTVNNTFTGLSASLASNNVTTATRYIDFKISPLTQYNLSLASISVPVSISGGSGSMIYSAAYSTDGTNFTQFSSAVNSGNVGAGNISNTYDVSVVASGTTITNFVPVTPITVNNGSTLIVRIIAWRKNSSSNNSTTVNIGPLTMVGNVTVVPTPTAPTADSVQNDNTKAYVYFTAPTLLPGVNAVTSYKVYAYANGSATASSSATALVSSLTLPYNILVTGLTNGSSYAFKVSAINSAGEGPLSNLSESVIPSANTTWNGVEWSAGEPDASQNAIIAANLSTSTSFTSNNFTLNSGVSFVNNGTFTIKGSTIVNNGTISGTGTLLLNGTSAQSLSGNGTVSNITVNTSAGASIASGSNKLYVTGVLILQTGLLTTNSNLTLKSTSITNSGILAPVGVSGNNGTISGSVSVERFIPKGFRAYRDLSAGGVFNASNSLFNTWQESGSYANNGYGIFVTGGSADITHTSNFLDATTGIDHSKTGYASAYYYKAGWDTVKNTKTTLLNPYQSYRILVRGDRSFDLYTTGVPMVTGPTFLAMINSTIVRASGSLITGNVTFNTSGVTNNVTGLNYQSGTYGLNNAINGYSYIANPYACPIDFHNIYTNNRLTNLKPNYYYLDPTIGSTGAWVSYNAITNVSTASSNGVTNGQFIQAGQGFLIGNTSTSPQIVITEADKSIATSSKTSVFGNSASTSKLLVSLLKNESSATMKMDAAVIVFGNSYNNGLGLEDATKMNNSSDNLSICEGANNFSIDGRLPATVKDVLSIKINDLSGSNYQFNIDASAFIQYGVVPYLADNFKQTIFALKNGINLVNFTVDNSVATSYQNRFSIIFKPTTLSVNSIVADAVMNNNATTISWNTVGENNVLTYQIEKSIDGNKFASIEIVTAKNTATANYSVTDKAVVTTTSYYRIKAINADGTIAYSNVVKMTTSNSTLTTIYPNPLAGKRLNIQLNKVIAGKYVVLITNTLGQKVAEETIIHTGGNGTHAINLKTNLSAGSYNVSILSNENNQLIHQSTLSVQP